MSIEQIRRRLEADKKAAMESRRYRVWLADYDTSSEEVRRTLFSELAIRFIFLSKDFDEYMSGSPLEGRDQQDFLPVKPFYSLPPPTTPQ
jgi:hypothetical protein